MTIVYGIVEKYNSSNVLTSRKWAPILNADVLLAGERALDYATIQFGAGTAVDQGDIVKYIQDFADTDFLYGIWNFQDSLRDESGYDQDGTTVNTVARYNQNPPARKMLKFTGVLNDQVKIPDATVPKAVINFSGQFDIIMLIKPDASSLVSTFFSKSDGATNGIELGIPSGFSPQYIYAELFSGGLLTTVNGSHVDIRDGGFHWVRVKRDENNLLTISVDGTVEYSATYSGNLTNSANLVFGNNFSNGGRHYNGYIAHVRIYCGGYLSDDDYAKVVGAREQPLTMKFAGLVYQQKTDSATKTTSVKAFSSILTDIQISPSVANNIYGNSTYSSIISNLITNYMTGWEYINDAGALSGDFTVTVGGIAKTLTTDYTISVDTSTSPYTYKVTSVTAFTAGLNNVSITYYYYQDGTTSLTKQIDTFSGSGSTGQVMTLSKVPNFITGYYVALDTLLNNFQAFTLLNNSFFTTTPRKTLIAEARDQDHTDIVFTNGKRFKITDNGKDSTNLVNDLEVIGGNKLIHTSQTFNGSGSAGQTFTLSHVPYSYTVTVGVTVKKLGLDYVMNQSTGVITTLTAFASGTNNVTVDYYYEGDNYVYRVKDNASILDNSATYSKSITLRGISDVTMVTQFANAYINRYKTKNRRYTINAPFLVNYIRPNYKVGVNNNLLNPPLADNLTIVSVNYKYPACTTTIIVGDYLYDAYDLLNQTQVKISQTYSTAVKANNT